jgi:hypothetical protein
MRAQPSQRRRAEQEKIRHGRGRFAPPNRAQMPRLDERGAGRGP